uniref:Uncharacterized protein LOC105032327 isoform X2 n=1 Tax=Elaeis guineensis var. tenera TaxID=51953 RepID=A0A8N4EWR1_ELAGV|nr:uncharacterized protein LOC105032327 isoform X2 [Elaeis guineensis]
MEHISVTADLVSFLLFCFKLSQCQRGEAIKCALQDFQANRLWVEGTQVIFAFKATHIRRPGNKVADWLADQASEEQFRITDHYTYSVPNVLANILYNDVHTVMDFSTVVPPPCT